MKTKMNKSRTLVAIGPTQEEIELSDRALSVLSRNLAPRNTSRRQLQNDLDSLPLRRDARPAKRVKSQRGIC